MDNMVENAFEDFSHFIEIVKNGRIWYKCTLCPNKEFQTKGHRKYHAYWHDKNKPKPYNCATCGAGFIVKSHFNYHLGTHTKEKPHKCSTCKKGFLSRSKLNRHVKIHAGKVYQCQHCVKKFATTTGRKQHEKTHSSKKRGNFRRNKKSRTQASTSSGEQKPFPCTTCDKEFKYAKDLKRHALVHTGERKFMCLICKEKHQRKDNLMRHIRKVHEKTEESAREFAWEKEDDEEPNASPASTSENDTDVEREKSSSEDGSSTTSESTDSEPGTEMAEVEERPEIYLPNGILNEEQIAVVDAMPIVADIMWNQEPQSPEPMTIVEVDDHVEINETVAEVIFNKDALVITRVMAKEDVDNVGTALDVVSNEEIKENVEYIIADISHCDGERITPHEEPVYTRINDCVYTTTGKAFHNDHSYAHIEYSTEAEPRSDSNLEAIPAIENANEGEILVDYNAVDQNASSCEGDVLSYDTPPNKDEILAQLLFSLKENPTIEHDVKINDTSANDIMYSAYLERKRITKEFLGFLYSEEAWNKENDPPGNIMTIDEFGVTREMEAGGILTFAKNRHVHVEPLLIQKIILYSSSSEPIFCTIEDTIIVNEQPQNNIIELHCWDTTENDDEMGNFNQEHAFNEDNLMKEEAEAISNNEDTWNSAFSTEGGSTMNAMESNCVVAELASPQDIPNTYEYHSNFEERGREESTENYLWNASESHGDYYGEQLHQADLQLKYGNVDNQDYFEGFHVNPEPNTGNVPTSGEERVENDMDKQAEGKVKLIQIPKKRQTSWYINEHN